jgi:hypothetical protein
MIQQTLYFRNNARDSKKNLGQSSQEYIRNQYAFANWLLENGLESASKLPKGAEFSRLLND